MDRRRLAARLGSRKHYSKGGQSAEQCNTCRAFVTSRPVMNVEERQFASSWGPDWAGRDLRPDSQPTKPAPSSGGPPGEVGVPSQVLFRTSVQPEYLLLRRRRPGVVPTPAGLPFLQHITGRRALCRRSAAAGSHRVLAARSADVGGESRVAWPKSPSPRRLYSSLVESPQGLPQAGSDRLIVLGVGKPAVQQRHRQTLQQASAQSPGGRPGRRAPAAAGAPAGQE